MWTASDKLACVERELGMRRRVYERRVAEGRMSTAQAQREISIMEEIAADYRKLEAEDRLF